MTATMPPATPSTAATRAMTMISVLFSLSERNVYYHTKSHTAINP